MKINSSTSTEGGWANSSLNVYLNNRIYNAFPLKWKQLMKQVKINSSIGNKSTEISSSNCYITVPAAIELSANMTSEPYSYEGTHIDYFTTNDSRILYDNTGVAVAYWTRSPNASYTNYWYNVGTTGSLSGYNYPDSAMSIRILISI